jgi:hypothetical protein
MDLVTDPVRRQRLVRELVDVAPEGFYGKTAVVGEGSQEEERVERRRQDDPLGDQPPDLGVRPSEDFFDQIFSTVSRQRRHVIFPTSAR